VRARILLVLGVVACTASVGNGQPIADPRLPEPCRVKAAEDLPALEKRKQRLEREIARGKQADANAKALTKTQAELLEVLFQIDCLKIRQGTTVNAAPPAPQPGLETTTSRSLRSLKLDSGKRGGDVVEVTTYFATNRGKSGRSEPESIYDASVGTLSYGRALVTIPTTHTPGSLELPSIWRLELTPDPSKHFILKSVTPLDPEGARAEMVKRLEAATRKALMVFVHGYNVSFAETAMRTAQLAHDLNFPGLPFFFSWPSAAQVTGYLRDVETAQLSEDAFDKVLDDLSTLPDTDVYLIAHSMGSRIVSQVLRSRVDRGKAPTRLSELLLAAPDINADLFRTVIAPRLQAMQGTQTTVYASSSDLALMASKAVHGYARVGETAGGVLVFPGLETIDASRATLSVRAFGHSYLTDSAAVLKDIQSILRQKLTARQRGLSEAGASPNVYWSLP
jgi:esterase/lipase superfamily enzyme